jgi:hypothetical protein
MKSLDLFGEKKLNRKITKYLLITAAMLMASPLPSFSEQFSPKYYIEEYDAPGLYDDKDLLIVEDKGIKYLIQQENENWYLSHFHKEIIDTVDLDGDGVEEAILMAHRTGNCCGPTFFIISKVQDGFFVITTHDELTGWPRLTIKHRNSEPEIWVRNISEGADETSMEETLSVLKFKSGKLYLVSKYSNMASIKALIEVTSEELSEGNDKILEIDLDFDGEKDKLMCSYWARWGAVNCNVLSSKFGKFHLSGGCNRVGVLESSTDGMRNLVCDRNDVLKFNLQELSYE